MEQMKSTNTAVVLESGHEDFVCLTKERTGSREQVGNLGMRMTWSNLWVDGRLTWFNMKRWFNVKKTRDFWEPIAENQITCYPQVGEIVSSLSIKWVKMENVQPEVGSLASVGLDVCVHSVTPGLCFSLQVGLFLSCSERVGNRTILHSVGLSYTRQQFRIPASQCQKHFPSILMTPKSSYIKKKKEGKIPDTTTILHLEPLF